MFLLVKSLAAILIILLTGGATQAQSVLHYWGVKAGFTLSTPTVTDNNVTYQVSNATGYQVAIGRFLPITSGLGVQFSGGLTQMRSTLRDARDVNFSEELSLTYGLLEAGLRGEKAIGAFKPFGTIAMRGSRLLRDNLHEIFFLPHRDSFDYGPSVSVGTEYGLNKVNPFVEISYYYGLHDVVSSNHIDAAGQLFENRIANRSWAFLMGIRF